MTTLEEDFATSGLTGAHRHEQRGALGPVRDDWASTLIDRMHSFVTALTTTHIVPVASPIYPEATSGRRRVLITFGGSDTAAERAAGDVAANLNGLLALPVRWDGRFASRLSDDAVWSATPLIFRLMGRTTLVPQIFPLPDGGLQFEWHADGNAVEVEVEGDGSIFVFARDSNGEVLAEGDDEAAISSAALLVADLAARANQS